MHARLSQHTHAHTHTHTEIDTSENKQSPQGFFSSPESLYKQNNSTPIQPVGWKQSFSEESRQGMTRNDQKSIFNESFL